MMLKWYSLCYQEAPQVSSHLTFLRPLPINLVPLISSIITTPVIVTPIVVHPSIPSPTEARAAVKYAAWTPGAILSIDALRVYFHNQYSDEDLLFQLDMMLGISSKKA